MPGVWQISRDAPSPACATDHETAHRFAAIPGAQLRHLFHNKHELTWIKIG
jgi:hypothetical protein